MSMLPSTTGERCLIFQMKVINEFHQLFIVSSRPEWRPARTKPPEKWHTLVKSFGEGRDLILTEKVSIYLAVEIPRLDSG